MELLVGSEVWIRGRSNQTYRISCCLEMLVLTKNQISYVMFGVCGDFDNGSRLVSVFGIRMIIRLYVEVYV